MWESSHWLGLKRVLCKILETKTLRSIDRCTGRYYKVTDMLKMALNTIQSINESAPRSAQHKAKNKFQERVKVHHLYGSVSLVYALQVMEGCLVIPK